MRAHARETGKQLSLPLQAMVAQCMVAYLPEWEVQLRELGIRMIHRCSSIDEAVVYQVRLLEPPVRIASGWKAAGSTPSGPSEESSPLVSESVLPIVSLDASDTHLSGMPMPGFRGFV